MSSRKAFEQALRATKMRERVTNQVVVDGLDEIRGIDHLLYCAYRPRIGELPPTRPAEGEDRGHVNWLAGHVRDADPSRDVYIPSHTCKALLLNPFTVAQMSDHAPLERLLPRMVYHKDERDGATQLSMLMEESFAEQAVEFFDYGIRWLNLYAAGLDLLGRVSLLMKLPEQLMEEHPPMEEVRPFVIAFYQIKRNLNLIGDYPEETIPSHYRGPCRVASLIHRSLRQKQSFGAGDPIPSARLEEVEKAFTDVAKYLDLYRKLVRYRRVG